MTHRRGPRDMSLPFSWRTELRNLAIILGWIFGLMSVWRIAWIVEAYF